MEGASSSKKRCANFTSKKMRLLLDETSNNFQLFRNPNSSENVKKRKDAFWLSLAGKLSGISGVKRTSPDVKVKSRNMQCNVKKKKERPKERNGSNRWWKWENYAE